MTSMGRGILTKVGTLNLNNSFKKIEYFFEKIHKKGQSSSLLYPLRYLPTKFKSDQGGLGYL